MNLCSFGRYVVGRKITIQHCDFSHIGIRKVNVALLLLKFCGDISP